MYAISVSQINYALASLSNPKGEGAPGYNFTKFS